MDRKSAPKERTNLADILANYTEVFVHRGEWTFRCPLHGEDKVPSGTINKEKQVWYCHACCRGGDVFGAVMAFERVNFPVSVRILSRNVGINVFYSKVNYKDISSKKH